MRMPQHQHQMEAEAIKYKARMNQFDIIRFQINYHCFTKRLRMSPAQIDALAYLALWGDMNISDYCNEIVAQDLFSNAQTVRNFVTKQVRETELIVRKGIGNKIISLTEKIDVLTTSDLGNILIDIKALYVEGYQGEIINS
jgi:ATP sulfurylase